jgi:hypothetical protein
MMNFLIVIVVMFRPTTDPVVTDRLNHREAIHMPIREKPRILRIDWSAVSLVPVA